jgi:hypothetical protein
MKQQLVEAFQEAIRSHCAAVTQDFFGRAVAAGTESESFEICKAYETILRLQYGLSDADVNLLIKTAK